MQDASSVTTAIVVGEPPSAQSTLLVELVAGGIAGIVSDASMHPLDTGERCWRLCVPPSRACGQCARC